MSLKTDLLLLGGLGVGAYILIANAGKIGEWIGGTIQGAIIQPVQTAIQESIITPVQENIISPVYESGVTAGSFVNIGNELLATVFPDPTAQTAIKSTFCAGLSVLPVFGTLATGVCEALMPASVDKTTTVEPLSTEMNEELRVQGTPITGTSPTGETVTFTPEFIQGSTGEPAEVASYYGRPSRIPESIWPSVRIDYSKYLMAGGSPYDWLSAHGF